MLQLDRRRNPYPYTWEIPAGTALLTLIVLVLGAQAGRSLALVVAGAGWHWPSGRNLLSSLPGILTGQPYAGLSHAPSAAAVTPSALAGWIIAVELVICTTLMLIAVWALKRWGPHRLRGMATAEQAEATLGLSRLRTHRHIIRPDLYPPTGR